MSEGFKPYARLAVTLLVLAMPAGMVASCGGGNGEKLGERVIPLGQPVPKGGGRYSVGKPYQIAGTWYQPREDPSYSRIGRASWYGELFHGRRTANGEIYDMERLSAAHPTLPLPVYARVTNLSNGRTIVVRVNDRGPYANDRIIDVSRRAAEALGFRQHGTAQVQVQYMARAPLNGDDRYEEKFLANQGWMQVAATARKPKVDPLPVGSIPGGTPLPQENPNRFVPPTVMAAKPQTAPFTVGTPPSVAPEAADPVTGILVQAGSFRDKDNADRARSRLAAIAPVEVAPVAVGSETFFRVRVGPFASDGDAKKALGQVRRGGYSGAKIVRN
ncbi:MAG: septal ring lytic transglycosylase RlpA family protein [Methyloceanibacter sp.]|uniref:septal ring lytic transglycosylase RlpA family protein n=1 Tax=Methyloceanibacter sp. TaxID=1965321 RepID=UPI003D9AE8B4